MTIQPPFSSLVLINPITSCWEWIGPINADGYGICCGALTHRVTYALFVGPIGEGLALDHLCRFRACCNPEHLEPVTPAENNARKPSRLREPVTVMRTADLTPSSVRELLTPGEVAQRLRVDPKTVTRWAVAGRLTSIRTPGGHRRYLESEVMALEH